LESLINSLKVIKEHVLVIKISYLSEIASKLREGENFMNQVLAIDAA
jgi:hypothetical protein